MTNFEKKKDECMKILADNMAIVNGKPVSCKDTNCYSCAFYKIKSACREQAMKWLLSEYQEPAPKLTKREREFLECFSHIEFKEIFRNDYGIYVNYKSVPDSLSIRDDMFSFIKRGDTWTFEELMKLEVEE